MTKNKTYIRVRIDSETKEFATEALDAAGLSIPDAIRLLLQHIADERRFPFDVNSSDIAARMAIAQLETGAGNVS